MCLSGGEQGRMRYTQTFRQLQRRYFVKCVAVTAVIFLITSTCAAQATLADQSEMPWAQELQKYPGLLPEFGQLLDKLQHNVQFPPARSQSRLLPLLPESTTFYGALPNYGDGAHQALTIFRQELQESSVLRDWWQHGEMAATGSKVEDSLEKFYQVSQYLGDEIVMSGAPDGRDHSLLILAEVRKPGLKDFLQQMVKELAGKSKPAVRVLDLKELATAKDLGTAQELMALVRPDFVVAALDLAILRSFNARLDRGSPQFASTPFGQRLAQAYQSGAEVLAAADLQKVLKQVPTGTEQSQMIFQRTRFADMKSFVWERKSVTGHTLSEGELSFTGPRRGIASWLAAPAPLGSLDFVSPKAILASTVVLKNLGEIFEDAKDLSTASNPNALAMLAQMEAGMGLSLKEDLLSQLGGEITLELDTVVQSDPVWKAILRVNDADRLQQTLSKLLASAPVAAQQSNEGGVTYHTLRIPAPQKTLEIGYAFVDGYLVIGSSRETVAEAVRFHRSGESLAKSKKFLASLPPGHSPEASALLYEDPIAMMGLSMRRVSPQMADLFSRLTAETTPVVVCAYGEESALREVSSSGGVDAGIVMVVAAIAIPNVLRAKMAANESSAVATIRTVETSQVVYSTTYPHRGYARDLATLGPSLGGTGAESAEHASLIDATLGNVSCTAGTWCTKFGFRFRVTAVCKQNLCKEFVVVGTPVTSDEGTRSFCSTSDAVVRFKTGPPLTSPLSASECRAWSPLR